MAAQTAAKDPRLNSNWGTIVEPPFPLGAQKLEGGQVQELTERLHTTETKSRVSHKNIPDIERPGGAKGKEEVQEIVDRLSKMTKPPAESKRIGAIEQSGILNSYAWKGWKTADSLNQQ